MHGMHIQAMNLSAYLIEQNLRDGDLANRIGMDASVICRIRNGRSLPSLRSALLIATVTGGRVQPIDLIPEGQMAKWQSSLPDLEKTP